MDNAVGTIQLPGREGRFRETAYDRLMPLVETLEQQLQPFMDRPFAFFGHSMGALIAFELTRRLQAGSGAGPVCLLVSARRAPQLPDRDMPIHQLPQDAFVQQLLQRYSGIPQTILEQPDLMALFSQTLRADFALIETYVYTPDRPLACPITAFGGTDDPHARRAELTAWSAQTSNAFGLHMISGDHFFLQNNQASLVRLISEVLLTQLNVKNG